MAAICTRAIIKLDQGFLGMNTLENLRAYLPLLINTKLSVMLSADLLPAAPLQEY